MTLTLSESHLCYCYDLIKSEPVGMFLSTATAIAAAVHNNTDGPDALLCVEVQPEALWAIYQKAAALPEGYAASINSELAQALMPQLTDEALIQQIQGLRHSYLQQRTANIESIRAALKPTNNLTHDNSPTSPEEIR